MEPASHQTRSRRRDLTVAGATFGVFLGMLGLSFAAVPLYDLFCRVTGFGGTTQVASAAPETAGSRTVTVRFDANIAPGLPWRFEPEVASVTLATGEVRTVAYRLRNTSGAPSTGIASFNVTPDIAGAYFSKIQCFCFTEQTLAAGEAREEVVVFFVDPAIEKDPQVESLHTITLSYTFFPSKSEPRTSASAAPAETRLTR